MFREHGKHMYPGTGVLGVEGEQVHLNCHCRTMYTHCCSMVVSYTGLNFMQSGWNMGVQNPMFMSMLGSQKFVVTSMANTAMYRKFPRHIAQSTSCMVLLQTDLILTHTHERIGTQCRNANIRWKHSLGILNADVPQHHL